MSPFLRQYLILLDQYDAIIDRPGWWEGERERLVAMMDALYPRLTIREQQVVVAHQQKNYDRRIKDR